MTSYPPVLAWAWSSTGLQEPGLTPIHMGNSDIQDDLIMITGLHHVTPPCIYYLYKGIPTTECHIYLHTVGGLNLV